MNETNCNKILRGHTSPETAFLVDDYPYGFRLRCKIRYWLEFKPGKGYRLVSQTTNPKVAVEVWNKPKASTYLGGPAWMFLDAQNHVAWTGVYFAAGAYPEKLAELRTQFAGQFSEEEVTALADCEKASRHFNPNTWAEFDAKQTTTPNA